VVGNSKVSRIQNYYYYDSNTVYYIPSRLNPTFPLLSLPTTLVLLTLQPPRNPEPPENLSADSVTSLYLRACDNLSFTMQLSLLWFVQLNLLFRRFSCTNLSNSSTCVFFVRNIFVAFASYTVPSRSYTKKIKNSIVEFPLKIEIKKSMN